MIFFAQGVAGPLCSRTTRTATVVGVRLHSPQGDDAAHDVEISDRQGLHESVAQHDLSPHLPRHVSRPRVPRGPCRGLDRGRGERLAHRADRATPADRGPGSGGSRQRLPASSKTRSSRAWRRGRSGGSPASAERVGESGGGGGSRTRVRNYLAKRIYVCIRFLFGFAARH